MMKEIWIAPTNPKYFDVINHLSTNDDIAIKNNQKRVNQGDIVYIYVASPVSEIRYKGIVVEEKCSLEILTKHKYVKNIDNSDVSRYFLLRITDRFDDGVYKYPELKQNGIGQVQILARASREIKQYFTMKEGRLL